MRTRKSGLTDETLMRWDSNNPPPPQPDEKDWKFVKELQAPLHRERITWDRANPRKGEADLRPGVRLIQDFPDQEGRLETACADFRRFLRSAGIPGGAYAIRACRERTSLPETYRIVVSRNDCRILAGDTEGIRRGLIFLEDEILRSGGPFLKCGTIKRRPVIRTRISRCFFGPINRPPKCRDELADDVNYYPDEYLNRLAHNGINGLWLSIKFKDTVPSKIIPEYGRDAARRLAKLQLTVNQCARYGIKIYVFCIEPAALALDDPALAAHPELGGQRTRTHAAFCPGTRKGKAYLEEATRTLFTRVRGLGGLIDISVGERFTHCASRSVVNLNCPRCVGRPAWRILGDVLSAMEKGMHAAAPEAEFISWPYTQGTCWGLDKAIEAAGHVPRGVILQHNFESYGRARQLGKWRLLGDYWLSYAGPSDLFSDCARRAMRRGTRMFAKLQVACSHEVASVPYVPVPGILHQKYKAMHKLGVSGAMLCWFFGNYPSLMNKAASELSFAPFPRSESNFLLSLARRDWGAQASRVARAWSCFRRGYEQYPHTALFGYYGPMHDGPTWPLHLIPANAVLAPTWQICYPPSGDRVGEAIGTSHTWKEALILCKGITREWRRGIRLLEPILRKKSLSKEQRRDIGVARALDIQFRSGYNILHFYALREQLVGRRRLALRARLGLLEKMRAIVREELANDPKLLELARSDPRLGFHSEAEGYKYYPERIKWRMRQLRCLLNRDFKCVEKMVRRGEELFPDYTGARPKGSVYACARLADAPSLAKRPEGGGWDALRPLNMNFHLVHGNPCAIQVGPYKNVPFEPVTREKPPACVIKLGYTQTHIYIGAICRVDKDALRPPVQRRSNILLCFESKRLWPAWRFGLSADGSASAIIPGDGTAANSSKWEYHIQRGKNEWWTVACIPLAELGVTTQFPRPIRFNALYTYMRADTQSGFLYWVAPKPLPGRLIYGPENPATDFGWLKILSI